MEASGPGGGHRAQEARLEKGSEDPPEAALPSITWEPPGPQQGEPHGADLACSLGLRDKMLFRKPVSRAARTEVGPVLRSNV